MLRVLQKRAAWRACGHLHLPVQSGSNRVFRRWDVIIKIESYIAQMDRLRELCPDVGLSTDLIVGFPTETEEDFEETFGFWTAFSSTISTPLLIRRARELAPRKWRTMFQLRVKNERLNRLLQYQLKIAEKRYAARDGQDDGDSGRRRGEESEDGSIVERRKSGPRLDRPDQLQSRGEFFFGFSSKLDWENVCETSKSLLSATELLCSEGEF